MNKKNTINYLQLMQRVFFVYRIALVLLVLAALFMPHAGAVDDMWVVANRIIKDVYTKIAGVSTVLAGLMSAVAVIGAKMSGTQQKADQAWDWLKRVWLAWVIINGIGAFIAYIRPLFTGLATLE
ncbi:hypothetical protein [Agathobaculum butyriciproducens]|uniref:hypothetical protein n=1 Tax=Agathobaculum butyriciproducens TaxID=1628085 RepID=UPI003AF1B226